MIDIRDIVNDKLVLLAQPRDPQLVSCLQKLAVRDMLVLSTGVQKSPLRSEGHVSKKLSALTDITQNNCDVAILDSWSSIALNRKRNFWKSRIKTILVPKGLNSVLYQPGVNYYSRSQRLAISGETEIVVSGRQCRFLVIEVLRGSSSHNRRVFAPHDWQPNQIFTHLNGLNYVLLRSVEEIEAEDGYKDIDILVSDSDLPQVHERFRQQIGLDPFEVYAEGGICGHDFQSVPYFLPNFARQILQSGIIRPSGIRVPSAIYRYLALVYHLLFHGKSRHLKADSELAISTFKKERHYRNLVALAQAAGFEAPQTFDQLDKVLKEHDAFPGKDLLGFYGRKNKFVAERYLTQKNCPGLAVFYVRDFGQSAMMTQKVAELLRGEFEILAEAAVTELDRGQILEKVRGGNWQDKSGDNVGEPIHWFVCWDPQPLEIDRKLRKKHPHLDNGRLARFKQTIRSLENGKRIIHSSDNSDEALEHIRILGVENCLEKFMAFGTIQKKEAA